MNTIIDNPLASSIADLSFSLEEDVCVSVSKKGEYKLWSMKTDSKAKVRWMCSGFGSLVNETLVKAQFSPDGSIVTIASRSVIYCDKITYMFI